MAPAPGIGWPVWLLLALLLGYLCSVQHSLRRQYASLRRLEFLRCHLSCLSSRRNPKQIQHRCGASAILLRAAPDVRVLPEDAALAGALQDGAWVVHQCRFFAHGPAKDRTATEPAAGGR